MPQPPFSSLQAPRWALARWPREETSPEIAWVKNNVVVKGANPDKATVKAKYRCTGDGVHLWASVKQGPGIDEQHTSSADADSWYETPEGPTPTCDGKNHVIRYTVSRVEGWDRLVKGAAWVQFGVLLHRR